MIDLGTPEALADPHALFREVRAAGPVQHSDAHRAWLVLSHAGVTAGFRDPRLSADRVPAFCLSHNVSLGPPWYIGIIQIFLFGELTRLS